MQIFIVEILGLVSFLDWVSVKFLVFVFVFCFISIFLSSSIAFEYAIELFDQMSKRDIQLFD